MPCLRSIVRRLLAPALLCWCAAAPAAAQTPLDVSAEKSFQVVFDAPTLEALPLGENIYALLETTQSELIADRFNSGGLNVGDGVRVGGFLGSWSQTRYRIGDIDITDPRGSGAALLFPEVIPWQRVTIGTAMFMPDTIAPGLNVDLEPRRAGDRWEVRFGGSGAGGSLVGDKPDDALADPIARLDTWQHGGALVSGPLSPRVGLMAGGTWTQAAKLVRSFSPAGKSRLTSGFANIVFSPSAQTEARVFGWVQAARVPRTFDYSRAIPTADPTEDRDAHLQASLQRQLASGLVWRTSFGFTHRSRTNEVGTDQIELERIFDGPMPAFLANTTDDTTRRLTLVNRLIPRPRGKHQLEYWLDLDRSSVRLADAFSGTVGERVDGTPARAWRFTDSGLESARHRTTFAVTANDHIAFNPRTIVDASVRLESVSGEASGATTGISWLSVLPRVALRWKMTDLAQLSLVAGYRRAANQLNLDLLAFGDPAAPTATVVRWAGGAPGTGASTVIDRVGPGTGGDPNFSRIDPDLARPYTDELVIGVESDRVHWLKWGLMGIARFESNLIGLTDVGAPFASYAPVTQLDIGQVVDQTFDDVDLTAYNRRPETFGKNQYVLTNPDVDAARSFALKMTFKASGRRFISYWVATASLAQGSAAGRGFGPLDNDQDAIGELFTNPNAAGFARGRLFADRAFTIKWTTVYRLPGDLTFGVIARYQDGQPMSRFVIATGLNQGQEILLAYPNASHRFTFTGTLDLRVQKGIPIGSGRAHVVFDAYNLVTRSNEVEEYVVTGPSFRTPTAIEPRPAVHLGLRFTF